MVQNYQNEIAPIFYYGISTKTNEKYLKSLIYSPLTEKVLTEWPCTYYKRKYKMWDIFCCLFNFFHSVSQEGLNPYTPTPNILKIMLGNYF